MKLSKIKDFIGAIICPGSLPLIMISEAADEPMGDQEISIRIKNALFGDTQFKYGLIQVEAHQGIVKLSGSVNTMNQKRHATDLANGVQGVRKVRNKMTVVDMFRHHLKRGGIFSHRHGLGKT